MSGFTTDPRFDAPDFVLFDTDSIPFGLGEARVNIDGAPHPGWGLTLWIDSDRVEDELYAKLETEGVTMIVPPYDSPLGRAFVFADPEGYRIKANEDPWDRFPLGGVGSRLASREDPRSPPRSTGTLPAGPWATASISGRGLRTRSLAGRYAEMHPFGRLEGDIHRDPALRLYSR